MRFEKKRYYAVTGVIKVDECDTAILRMIALGYSDKEIAAELFKSLRAVNNRIANMIDILEVKNRVGIVLVAIAKGWIHNPYNINPTEN